MTHHLIALIVDGIPLIYLITLSVMAIYGFHKLLLVWRFYRHKNRSTLKVSTSLPESELPKVTVQLPIFNEMYVAGRLLTAISNLNYPIDKLEIQILDDSDDETQKICRDKVSELKKKNFNVQYIHRQNRSGFKAGALANGLKYASGELVIIFDADFIPTTDVLLKMVPYFSDLDVGMVQARWSHINRHYSSLTEIQALMLDGHFLIEQTARNRSGCFFNFNGTAGMWRVQAIQDAGGWQHTTVTEDLDLSYRVQLQDWRCIYLPHIIVPAELPMEMNSFKSQQFRWAKGASQVFKKLLIPVLKSDAPFYVKLEAFLHLTNNFNYCLLLVLLLLSLPYQAYIAEYSWHYSLLIYLPIFLGTTFNLFYFYGVSQREQGIRLSFWTFGRQILLLMSVGIGLSINQSLAVCDGLLRYDTAFVRTPKHGVVNAQENWITKKYRAAKTWVPFLELLMLLYLLSTVIFAFAHAHYLSLPFLCLFLIGHLYILKLSIFQQR